MPEGEKNNGLFKASILSSQTSEQPYEAVWYHRTADKERPLIGERQACMAVFHDHTLYQDTPTTLWEFYVSTAFNRCVLLLRRWRGRDGFVK